MSDYYCKPAGDGHIVAMSSFNVLGRAQQFDRQQVAALADGADHFELWAADGLHEQLAIMRGQAAFLDCDLAGACLSLKFKSGSRATDTALEDINLQIREALAQEIAEHHQIGTIAAVRADALIFASGEISIALELRMPDGWNGRAMHTLSAATTRNRFAKAICLAIVPLYSDLIDRLQVILARQASGGTVEHALQGRIPLNLKQTPQIDSLHILYAGEPAGSIPSNARPLLHPDLRPFIYPTAPESVRSQSPDVLEFVYLGYAFSMVISKVPLERLRELTLIVQVMHCLFNELTSVSEDVESYLQSAKIARLRHIRPLRRRIRSKYDQLRSPVFTFRHEMLVFRDHILREWFIERSLAHAEHLIDALISHEQARQATISNGVSAVISFLLFIIASLSLISVAADYRTLTTVDAIAPSNS